MSTYHVARQDRIPDRARSPSPYTRQMEDNGKPTRVEKPAADAPSPTVQYPSLSYPSFPNQLPMYPHAYPPHFQYPYRPHYGYPYSPQYHRAPADRANNPPWSQTNLQRGSTGPISSKPTFLNYSQDRRQDATTSPILKECPKTVQFLEDRNGSSEPDTTKKTPPSSS